MAQYSYIKTAGGLLVPATRDARDFLRSKKVGSVLYADFKQARNPAFHRKLFSLLNLGFDYWQPSGGAISPADKALVNGYVKFLAYYAGGEEALQAAADEYLVDVAEKRAGNISAAKSFEAFRAWVTIQAGFYTEYLMPDGTTRREPKSISFAKMDDNVNCLRVVLRYMQIQFISLDMTLVGETKIATVNGVVFNNNSPLTNIIVIAFECNEIDTVFHVAPFMLPNGLCIITMRHIW